MNHSIKLLSNKTDLTCIESRLIGTLIMSTRENIRVSIKTLHLAGYSVSSIFDQLKIQYGADSPSLTTVRKWVREVKWGRHDLKDSARTGRPPEVTTQWRITEAKNIVDENPSIGLRELSERIKVSHESARSI